MSTQEIPAYRAPESKVLIGAGTALKTGFFFAFGMTLFSIVVSLIVGILALVFGASLIPAVRQLLGF